MDDDFCKSVLAIPQYQNTCWFTTILMCLLKSQYSRKFLINKFKITDSSPKIIKIVYKMLINTYIANPKTYEYYKKFNIHNFIKYFIDDNNLITNIIKNGTNILMALVLFMKKLNVKSLSLHKFDNKNDIYCGFYDYIEYKYFNKSIPNFEDFRKNLEIQFNKKLNPDYIFLTIYDEKAYDNYNNDYLHICNIDNFKKIKYDKNLKELKSFKFNNNNYILDSCLLNNYNANQPTNKKNVKIPGHSIAGITCKNDKYVYNGWIKSTKDPAMLERNVNFIPCALIKHDWEVNNKNDCFCLNPIQCKLDNANPKNLCFSFGKGYRTLIFVKTKKQLKSIDENISNSSLYPSSGILSKIKKTDIKKVDIKTDIKKIDIKTDICKEWLKNKNINPETKRKIKDTSPIYKKYLKLCNDNNDNNDDNDNYDKIKDLCKEWIKNKNVNPTTKRKIKDTSPIYKNYIKLCNKFI
jgi:hypothetical protein